MDTLYAGSSNMGFRTLTADSLKNYIIRHVQIIKFFNHNITTLLITTRFRFNSRFFLTKIKLFGVHYYYQYNTRLRSQASTLIE